MDAAEIYAHVEARLPETVDMRGERLTHEVLAELAEHLLPDEAAELGAELPEELGDLLAHASGRHPLERDHLIEAVATRLDLDDDDAETATMIVLSTIREALEPHVAIDQVLESLPRDLAQLMQ
jgi:uncharacterized protein (DUF2267 family)